MCVWECTLRDQSLVMNVCVFCGADEQSHDSYEMERLHWQDWGWIMITPVRETKEILLLQLWSVNISRNQLLVRKKLDVEYVRTTITHNKVCPDWFPVYVFVSVRTQHRCAPRGEVSWSRAGFRKPTSTAACLSPWGWVTTRPRLFFIQHNSNKRNNNMATLCSPSWLIHH